MKKTIMTLLALGAAVASGAEYEATTTGGQSDSGNIAAYYGWALQWGDTYTLTYATDMPASTTLREISIVAGGGTFSSAVKLAVYEVSSSTATPLTLTTLAGVSGETSYVADQASVFDFSDSAVVLENGKSYAFLFVNTSATEDTLTTSNYTDYATTYRITFNNYINEASTASFYYNVAPTETNEKVYADTAARARYTTQTTMTVPEPATATLSLLALAGLAARRRRK